VLVHLFKGLRVQARFQHTMCGVYLNAGKKGAARRTTGERLIVTAQISYKFHIEMILYSLLPWRNERLSQKFAYSMRMG